MRRTLARNIFFLAILLGLAANPGFGDDPAPEENRFDAAIARIHQSYWQEISREELEERALRALLKELDPYGQLLDATQWGEFRGNLSGTIAGVGVILDSDATGGLQRIQRLLVASAAGAAGARPGDRIEAIDGRSLQGVSLDDVFPLLRGAPGTSVRLRLSQPGASPHEIDVVRKIHNLPSVHGVGRDADGVGDYLLDAAKGIGYLRIDHLSEDSFEAVRGALEDLTSRQASGLVLDLRGSSGGLMMAGVRIADLFLGEGLVGGAEGREESTRQLATASVSWAGPMVVLIDGDTASSSEFLAASLRDHGRARFLGERTFGKGRIQQMYSLGEGRGGLILTTALQVRPSGIATDKHDPPPANESAGVFPDPGLEMHLTDEELASWRKGLEIRASPSPFTPAEFAAAGPDPILDRAVALLTDLEPATPRRP
ncbi:MAG: S41 family peptidase [Thermoanaerobaculia bacterium]